MQGKYASHCENEGTVTESRSHSNNHSIEKCELQGDPLTKAKILDVYSDIFIGIGKCCSESCKFQLTENTKPTRHASRKVAIHLQDAFHKEIRNWKQLGILEPIKEVIEWVNSFVIMEKKVPCDSSNSHS